MNQKFFQNIKIRQAGGVFVLMNALGMVILNFSERGRFDPEFLQVLINVSFLVWFFWKNRVSFLQVREHFHDFRKHVSLKEIFSLFCTCLGLAFGLIFLIFALVAAVSPEFSDTFVEGQKALPSEDPSLLIRLFLLVLVGPFTEEIVWRGVILNRLLLKTRVWVALFVTTVVFAVLHVQPLQIMTTFLTGLLLGILYLKTKNIFASLALHVMVNSFVFFGIALALISEKSPVSPEEVLVEAPTADEFKIVGLVLGIPLTLVSSFFYIRYVRKNWPRRLDENGM